MRAFDDNGEPIQHPLCRIDGSAEHNDCEDCWADGYAEGVATIVGQRDELLAALKVAEEFVHYWMERNTSEHELAALEQIERAIAKAEGR